MYHKWTAASSSSHGLIMIEIKLKVYAPFHGKAKRQHLGTQHGA